MPGWVTAGFDEYARRMPPSCSLELVEIPSQFRGKNADVPRLLALEGQKMLQAVPKGATVVALDPKGKSFTTEKLATRL